MSDELTILYTGDLHLGRHPSRIPAELDGRSFSPRSIWRKAVRAAIDRDVDVVAITGDVVDRENRYFEAYGAFEAGVTRLDEAEIPTVAVAGNHDYDVLPRMVDDLDLDRLVLLGEGGTWGRWTLERNGEPLAHFDGWSFPSRHVLASPLEGYTTNEVSEPVVGLLHADLDAPRSQYAPVRTNELLNTRVDAWLLGHIHRPGVRVDANPLVSYPGSPQPLDPGERNAHGPWLLTLDATAGIEAEQLPLATVRYDRLEVEVSQADDPKDVPPLVSARLDEHVRADVDTAALELLLARIRLTGRTTAHADVVERRTEIERQLAFTKDELPVHVETLEVDTRPAADFEELTDGDSPVAYVASLLSTLETDGVGEYDDLVEDTLDAMQEAHAASAYNLLRREGTVTEPDEADARAALTAQARLLLETLLEQKEGRT